MKTIAHTYCRYSPGVLLDLHNELLKKGRYGSVLLAERYVPNSRELFPRTRYFYKVPKGDIFHKLDNVISETPIYRKLIESFYKKMLREEGSSLIHAHFGMAGCSVMDLARQLKLPLVVTLYGVDGSFCLKSNQWIPRFKKLFDIADRMIVLCDEVKNRLVSLGCKEDKVRIWNCLEDVGFYTYSKRPAAGPVNFIIAARFVEKKGYPLLLNAFARLAKEHGDIRLTIIGYGNGRNEVIKLCQNLGLMDKVIIVPTDTAPDFSAIYKDHLTKSHIFVLPSIAAKNGDDEGGPALTLIAAQAAGLPVIATRFPGAERSIIDGKTGVYCDPDPSSVYEKMLYLYERPALWDEIGSRASAYVKKEFDVGAQVEKIESIYAELLKG